MPVEVRELIIKTEIKSSASPTSAQLDAQELKRLKQQILDECLKLFKDKTRSNSFNR